MRKPLLALIAATALSQSAAAATTEIYALAACHNIKDPKWAKLMNGCRVPHEPRTFATEQDCEAFENLLNGPDGRRFTDKGGSSVTFQCVKAPVPAGPAWEPVR